VRIWVPFDKRGDTSAEFICRSGVEFTTQEKPRTPLGGFRDHFAHPAFELRWSEQPQAPTGGSRGRVKPAERFPRPSPFGV